MDEKHPVLEQQECIGTYVFPPALKCNKGVFFRKLWIILDSFVVAAWYVQEQQGSE